MVMDTALSPVQQRNLERAWGCKVIDRTGLILDIFGERARTREGALQVELAHLDYQRSRLVRSWTHLERQRGGFGFLGGPGETQIEADRRLISTRIARLKRGDRGGAAHARAASPCPPAHALSGDRADRIHERWQVDAVQRDDGRDRAGRDQLFATLDPTMRSIALPSGTPAILSDTVGFISDLPTELVAAFRATLEEVAEADVILHVRDIAHPDTAAQKADVLSVLAGMVKDGTLDADWSERTIDVLNKADLLGGVSEVPGLVEDKNTVSISALNGDGLGALRAAIDERLASAKEVASFQLVPSDGAKLAWLYRHGEVLTRADEEEAIHVTVRMLPADRARFESLV